MPVKEPLTYEGKSQTTNSISKPDDTHSLALLLVKPLREYINVYKVEKDATNAVKNTLRQDDLPSFVGIARQNQRYKHDCDTYQDQGLPVPRRFWKYLEQDSFLDILESWGQERKDHGIGMPRKLLRRKIGLKDRKRLRKP